MIIFVQDDAGCNSIKGFFVMPELFIQIFNGHFFRPVNIFSDSGDTQTALIIQPVITMFFNNMSIDKCLFNTRCIRITFFFPRLLIHISKYLGTVHHK